MIFYKILKLLASLKKNKIEKSFLKEDRFKWNYIKKTESAEGIKTFYFCNGKNCACKAYILCLPDSYRASAFMSAERIL